MGKKSKRSKQKPSRLSGHGGNNESTQRPSVSVREAMSTGWRNPFKPTTRSELDAITTPPVVSSDEQDPIKATNGATCWICLEGPEDDNPEPLRRNCACRGSIGYVHLTCMASFAASRSEGIWTDKQPIPNGTWLAFAWPWESCPNCKQFFSGKLRLDIRRALKISCDIFTQLNTH